MVKKVFKNVRVVQCVVNVGLGCDYVKVIKSIKDFKIGKYFYKEVVIYKDVVKEFFVSK